jgi:UDP-glucose 4-epimerase
VLEAAVAAGVPKVVFASSGAATGFSFQGSDRRPRYLPLDEAHPCEPEDSYGLSKLMGETMCARWSRAFGMATVCLRINHNWCVDRAGAEQAVMRGGWAKGLAVEDLWERYRLQLDRPDRPRSSDSPPPPRDILWAVTDTRDCAQAFRLAVENETVRHEVFLINGFDTCSYTPSAQLAAEHFPEAPLREPLSGHGTLVSHRKASALLGYAPRHSWRESDFASWYRDSVPPQARRTPT